jgi:cyclophilin family peptidyl-prolyl cis-trans isomerase
LTDEPIASFDKIHTIFGVIVEGLDDVLQTINLAYVNPKNNRPLQNIKIKHTVIIDEADFENDDEIDGLAKIIPSRSPSPVR